MMLFHRRVGIECVSHLAYGVIGSGDIEGNEVLAILAYL